MYPNNYKLTEEIIQKKEYKFAVDCMLGKLAKNLRILGYDTFYKSYIDDAELVEIAYKQQRIILTRDKGLIKRKKAKNYIYIKSTIPKEQIKEVQNIINIDKNKKPLTRCLICNSVLKKIDKKSIENRVPKYTYSIVQNFYICEKCNKIYWSATHIQSMKKKYNIQK